MTLAFSTLFLVAPLLLYLLHALWRLIASDNLISTLVAVFAYLLSAVLFRLCLPTLSLLPVWLPFLYAGLWLGLAGLLAIIACGDAQWDGLRLRGLSQKTGCYFMAQFSLLYGIVLLNPVLSGKPLQAFVALPPFAAISGYLLYCILLRISRNRQRTPWWALVFAVVLPPIVLSWVAEILVPLLLRYL